MRKPSIKTYPYLNGWPREDMTEAEENFHIASRKRKGLKNHFTKQPGKIKWETHDENKTS